MRTLDTVIAPLRASQAAMAPYLGNLQDRYAGAEKYARARAADFMRHQPRTARLLTNRYVLFSLAAGACVFAMRRLQRWRQQHVAAAKTPQRGAPRALAARKTKGRAPARSTRVH